MALVLAGSMVVVPLLALGSVDEADPTRVRVSADVAADAELAARTTLVARASRSEVVETTTTVAVAAAAPAPETTTTTEHVHPTTTTTHVHPTTTTTHVHRSTTTTVKPTTTSTTARPTTTTTTAPAPAPAASGSSAEGPASWYEASGDVCAHRTLPFGTIVRVTNLGNGKQVSCRVGDRGPYTGGRIIDLSRDGFAAIAALETGVIQVRIEW